MISKLKIPAVWVSVRGCASPDGKISEQTCHSLRIIDAAVQDHRIEFIQIESPDGNLLCRIQYLIPVLLQIFRQKKFRCLIAPGDGRPECRKMRHFSGCEAGLLPQFSLCRFRGIFSRMKPRSSRQLKLCPIHRRTKLTDHQDPSVRQNRNHTGASASAMMNKVPGLTASIRKHHLVMTVIKRRPLIKNSAFNAS